MAKSAALVTHIGNITDAIATEVALYTADNQIIRDRPGFNVRDVIVKAVDAAVVAEDWSDV